jgi:hypothetical protein
VVTPTCSSARIAAIVSRAIRSAWVSLGRPGCGAWAAADTGTITSATPATSAVATRDRTFTDPSPYASPPRRTWRLPHIAFKR